MSHIELKLVADTAADLSGLIAGLQAQMGAAAVPIVVAAAEAPADEPKTTRKGKAEKAATDAPAAAGTGSTTTTEAAAAPAETKTEAGPGSSDEDAPKIEYADVQAATTALAAAKGRDAAIGCLAEFDVKNGKDLREDQWGAYVARAKELAEG